jgi:hypothetical protein
LDTNSNFSSKYNPKTFNLIYIRKFEISFSENLDKKIELPWNFHYLLKLLWGWLLIEVAYEHIFIWVLAPSINT